MGVYIPLVIFVHVCTRVHLCVCMYVYVRFLYHVVLEAQTQSVKLGGRHLYPLSQLTKPTPFCGMWSLDAAQSGPFCFFFFFFSQNPVC